jgi:cystathionine beta-lyase/cystathionine gamma-synthase
MGPVAAALWSAATCRRFVAPTPLEQAQAKESGNKLPNSKACEPNGYFYISRGLMNFKTLAIHAGYTPQEHFGAVMTPIYQTSTFAFRGVSEPGPFDYSRSGNPTRKALESCLAALEGGTAGFAFATGMAAEATLLMMFESGDTIVVHDDLYGGTYRLFESVLATKQIRARYVDLRNLSKLSSALAAAPKAVWVESPTNPLMNLVDIRAVSELAHQHGALVICDNTFLSPYFQRPLELGADIVVHSTTKYINGHSDVVGGAIVVKDSRIGERIYFLQNAMGTCAGPQDCFLVLRGIKTLAVRMEEHNRNALQIARWLEKHPKVSAVLHPGLESHPQHELALCQAQGFGGTFSFRLRGGEAAVKNFLAHCRVFTLAESLGGVESLLEHPCTMSHASVPRGVQLQMGITPDLIRISVGLEDVGDLIADLDAALAGC